MMDFPSPRGVHPSCGCSFSSFASCGHDPLLQPAAEQLWAGKALPTHSLSWRYPMTEAQHIGDVSSRPPGLAGSDLNLQRTQQTSKMLSSEEYIPPREALDGKSKVFWVASSCKMPFIWSPGGTDFLVQPTSSPECLSDNCFSKFCVQNAPLFTQQVLSLTKYTHMLLQVLVRSIPHCLGAWFCVQKESSSHAQMHVAG